jgi:hypothetical protein
LYSLYGFNFIDIGPDYCYFSLLVVDLVCSCFSRTLSWIIRLFIWEVSVF